MLKPEDIEVQTFDDGSSIVKQKALEVNVNGDIKEASMKIWEFFYGELEREFQSLRNAINMSADNPKRVAELMDESKFWELLDPDAFVNKLDEKPASVKIKDYEPYEASRLKATFQSEAPPTPQQQPPIEQNEQHHQHIW